MDSYEAARRDIKTGSVILFSGTGPISIGIRLFTRSIYSHVGLAYRIPDIDALLLYESTTLSNVADLDGELREGVQLVLLSERVRTYPGRIDVRHLSEDLTQPQREALGEFRQRVKGRPYEQSRLELVKSAWDGGLFSDNTEDLSSLFCSELVAEALQACGVLDDGAEFPSNEFTPADFAGDALPLLGGLTLGDPVRLK